VYLVCQPLFALLYHPQTKDDDEYRAVDGMIGKGIQSTQRRPAPVPLCPPQIPHDLTQAALVGRSYVSFIQLSPNGEKMCSQEFLTRRMCEVFTVHCVP
jgi:hypothetical protein